MTLLKTEFPKRLEESVTEVIDTLRTCNDFELTATEWNRKILISIFKKASRDIQSVDTNFPMEKLPFLKDYFALKSREAEEAKEVEKEESEGESGFSEGFSTAHGTSPDSPSTVRAPEVSSTAPTLEP